MPAITVRGVTLLPPRDTAPTNFKILVPVMANDLSNAAAAGAAGDVVELRLDALSILDAPNVQNVLCAARAAIGQGVPLLATIRTKKEGGLADLTDAAYGELGTAICHSGLADLLDVEASTAPAVIAAIQQQARESGVKTVFSSHNFAETPPTETMVNTLTDM
ncbi:MAG: type I 3-dehydroquinate dehydratase, partial [Gemmiger qucibialis]